MSTVISPALPLLPSSSPSENLLEGLRGVKDCLIRLSPHISSSSSSSFSSPVVPARCSPELTLKDDNHEVRQDDKEGEEGEYNDDEEDELLEELSSRVGWLVATFRKCQLSDPDKNSFKDPELLQATRHLLIAEAGSPSTLEQQFGRQDPVGRHPGVLSLVRVLCWAPGNSEALLQDSPLGGDNNGDSSTSANNTTTGEGNGGTGGGGCSQVLESLLWRMKRSLKQQQTFEEEKSLQKTCAQTNNHSKQRPPRHLQCALEIQHVLAAVRGLALGSEGIRCKIVGAGMLPLIKEGMARYMSEARLQEQALGALNNLLFHSDVNKDLATRQDLLPLVKKAMESHPHDADVQNNACGVLLVLATTHANKAKMVAELKFIPLVKKAMLNHLQDPSLQDHAVGSLWNMVASNMTNKRILVAGERMLPVVAKVMMSHLGDSNVQEQATGFLWCLLSTGGGSDSDQIRTAVAQEGTILSSLKRTMDEGQPRNELVIRRALASLALMAEVSSSIRRSLNSHGMIPSILSAINRFPNRDVIVEPALLTLSHLSLERSCARQLVNQDRIWPGILLSLAEIYRTNTGIQARICEIFRHLSSVRDLHSNLLIGGMLPLIKRIMSENPLQSLIQEQSCATIRELLINAEGDEIRMAIESEQLADLIDQIPSNISLTQIEKLVNSTRLIMNQGLLAN